MKNTIKNKVIGYLCRFWGITILISGVAFAQIPNGGFQTLLGSCTPSSPNIGTDATAPFQQGCVTDWYTSHGTPQIIEYSNGNRAALLWAGDFNVNSCPYSIQDGGEGIMMHCGFKRGEKYTISMDIRTSDNPPGPNNPPMDQVLVFLANDMVPRTDINYCPGETSLYYLPNVPDKQMVFLESAFTSSTFVTKVFTVQPDRDFEWLWIFPREDDDNRIVIIDNVRLITCPEYQIYSNTSNLPALTKRGYFILAYNKVSVLNGQDVEFQAGNYVKLDPGFEAEPGSVFLAHIVDDCSKLACGDWDPEGGGENPDEKRNLQEKQEVVVYPNPSNGDFNLNFPPGMEHRFVIFDINGRIVKDFLSSEGSASLEMEDQVKGIYFLRWKNSAGKSGTAKLILQ